MWQTKTFETRDEMDRWIKDNEGKVQYEQIFVNNGYAVEWRALKVIDFGDDGPPSQPKDVFERAGRRE